MKTYCKNLNLTDQSFIFEAILAYLHDKIRKRSTVRFISGYTGYSESYVRNTLLAERAPEDNSAKDKFLISTCMRLAKEMSDHISLRTVREHIIQRSYGEKIIRYLEITDTGSKKRRDLGLEATIFRLYEAVANEAAMPLFRAKVGEFQIGSIKGKGQAYGRKAILRWMSRDPEGTKYGIQADVSKCYPSIPHENLKAMYHRDLKKSQDLLYLLDTFLLLYEEYPNPKATDPHRGILIGSPVSKDLCNYFVSRLYHYASEKLYVEKKRRGVVRRERMLSHIIIYADDILIFGQNKRLLHNAMKMISAFARDCLGLTVKPSWVKFRTQHCGRSGRLTGCVIDFIGLQFHGGEVTEKFYYGRRTKHRRAWVTIRGRTFIKAKRKLFRFTRMVKRSITVTQKFAKSLVSYYGCFTNTDAAAFRRKNKVDQIMRIARRIISDYVKGKPYHTTKYYDMWRSRIA
jgi:hypothetical protein